MFTRTFNHRPQPSALSAAPGFAVQRFIQPKLVVGPVDDPFEREADQMAERVIQRSPGPLGLSRVGAPAIQRCDEINDDCEACRGIPVGVIQPEALPTSSVGPAGATASPHVEAGIQRSQGGGQPLSEPVRGAMESSFGTDFHLVRVHSDGESDRLNRSLSARAFTAGRDIFFRHGEYRPGSRAGQRLLAHELTHVVQQGAAGKEIVQRKFGGPKLNNAVLTATAYPGHAFAPVSAVQAHTACGTENQITTAGEQVNGNNSDAGDPNGFATYRDGYSIGAGLVKDKARTCAATRMHLINHRLEDSGNTQQNPNNIMLGTQRSNNPTHLHQVENPTIGALAKYASRRNAEYETAMQNAVDTQDPAGKDALFWPNNQEPDAKAVHGYQQVYLIGGNAANGYRLPAAQQAGDTKGFGLTTDGYAPPNNRLYHLWLIYNVRANYAGRPAYVDTNINREQAANTDPLTGNAKDANIDQNIKDFDGHWADHAFPRDFTCTATYYTATYKRWGAGNSYRVETENQTIASDL